MRSHNISVFAASGAAALVATIGWALVFAMSYWVALIAAATSRGIEAQPEHFGENFLYFMGAATAFAAVDAWLTPHERACDRRPKLAQLYDVILFIPRITFATAQNFSAWAYLSGPAVRSAARLITRLRSEQRVPLHELPLDMPNPHLRRRVLAVLELTQLTDIRTEKGQLVLRWSALAPDAFRHVPHIAEAAEMKSAKAAEKMEHLPGPGNQPTLEDRYRI